MAKRGRKSITQIPLSDEAKEAIRRQLDFRMPSLSDDMELDDTEYREWLREAEKELCGDVAKPPQQQKSKGGRPPVTDWDAIEEVFRKKIAVDGCPEKLNVKGWQTQADVVTWIRNLDRFARSAAESTVRDHARDFISKYCKQGERGN
jgi:hypothetical protein